jgi:hypothetical protein
MTRKDVLDVLQDFANLFQAFRLIRSDVRNSNDIIGYSRDGRFHELSDAA